VGRELQQTTQSKLIERPAAGHLAAAPSIGGSHEKSALGGEGNVGKKAMSRKFNLQISSRLTNFKKSFKKKANSDQGGIDHIIKSEPAYGTARLKVKEHPRIR